MGSSSSKAARRTLPKAKAASKLPDTILPDQHLISKLNQLGPVRVDHGAQRRVKEDIDVQHAGAYGRNRFSAIHSESSGSNHLSQFSLSALLEAAQKKSPADYPALASQYKIDLQTLQKLVQFVNLPSTSTPGKPQSNAIWV